MTRLKTRGGNLERHSRELRIRSVGDDMLLKGFKGPLVIMIIAI